MTKYLNFEPNLSENEPYGDIHRQGQIHYRKFIFVVEKFCGEISSNFSKFEDQKNPNVLSVRF
jgi:hypothetical protein